MRKFESIFIFLVFCLTSWVPGIQAEAVKTPAEEALYTRYSQHEEIARFLSELDFLSPELVVQVIGRTRELREFPSKDLFMCIITGEGVRSPEGLNRRKPTILLIASQHGNEHSAKEAALGLARDLALGELRPLLEKVNFLIVPQANPYGNWFDRRQNEQGLDLNRDHVKLEAEETRALHRVFRAWMPEVTMDIHEKGDDYYRVSIGCVSNINIDPQLQKFSRDKILTLVRKDLEDKKITFFEYLVTQEMGLDSSAGVRYRPDELAGREEMRRYSTTDLNDGRNSFGIYETLSFIQEGASRHDLETLAQRTRWQYHGIRSFIETIASCAEEVTSLVRSLRSDLLDKATAYNEKDVVYLSMDYIRDPENPSLTIHKFERAESPVQGILKVDKNAGEAIEATDLAPYPFPAEQKVIIEIVKNWFPRVEGRLSVSRPLGYIIPAKHQDVIECLLAHRIEIQTFIKDITLEACFYEVGEVIPSKYDYLPPEKLGVMKKSLPMIVKRGDYFVSCIQIGTNLVPCLLEPQSQYGLIRYWNFELVPRKGDIFAFYRLEKKADLPLIPYRNWGE